MFAEVKLLCNQTSCMIFLYTFHHVCLIFHAFKIREMMIKMDYCFTCVLFWAELQVSRIRSLSHILNLKENTLSLIFLDIVASAKRFYLVCNADSRVEPDFCTRYQNVYNCQMKEIVPLLLLHNIVFSKTYYLHLSLSFWLESLAR